MNFSVYLDDKLTHNLDDIARKRGMKRNALIREAIQLWLKTQKKDEWPSSVTGGGDTGGGMRFEAYRDQAEEQGMRDIIGDTDE